MDGDTARNDEYLERDFVRFYDWMYRDHVADEPFYAELARESGSPILEAACGTARLLIPLARAGLDVVGFDFSPHMLAVARAKLDKEPPEVQARAQLVQADMRSFDLGRTFSAVLVPNASVFHLRSREELAQCFACLSRHTRPGGLVVVDVVAPRRMAGQEVGPRVKYREAVNPETGLLTQELNRKLAIDRRTQTVRVEHTYVEGEGAQAREFLFEQTYRWVEEDETVELLAQAGLSVAQTLGDHQGIPYAADSPRLILLSRKPEALS